MPGLRILKERLSSAVSRTKSLAHKALVNARIAAVKIRARNMLKRKEIEIKEAILERFPEKRIDEIAFLRGIRLLVRDPITNEIRKARNKREKIIVLARKLSVNDVFWFAKTYGIKYRDKKREYERFRKSVEEWLVEEIKRIRNS